MVTKGRKGQTRTYNILHRILKTEQHEYYKRTKGQTRTYNILHRVLKTEQHEHYQNRVNMCALITTIFFLSTSQY